MMQQPVVQPEYRGHSHSCKMRLSLVSQPRGVGNARNLVHLVEKSVEIKLKSWEIKADFLEIKLGNQHNPPAPPTLQHMTSFLREFTGKSKRNLEISYAKIARCRPLGQPTSAWREGSCQLSIQLISNQNIISCETFGLRIVWLWDN